MSDWSICGVLIQARPEQSEAVAATLGAHPGVEVHGRTPRGRVIPTLERVGQNAIIDTLAGFHQIPGVLAASLIYEHSLFAEPPEESPP